MATLKPLAELLPLTRTTTARAFAERFPDQDIVVAEPYEKARDYRTRGPLHAATVFMPLARTVGQPVPVGRDARALVQLDHAAVSRLHLVMAWANEGWKGMDRSSNGTFIDEEKMPQGHAHPLPYGAMIRLGRAMVLRVLTPEAFHELARGPAAPVPPSPPSAQGPPADPRASTWRFAPVQNGLLQPDSSDELGAPLTSSPGAPTLKMARPGSSPPPPPPPKPPPGKVDTDGIQFEFDLDFGDGKGGFA
jgi:hypothetical protein